MAEAVSLVAALEAKAFRVGRARAPAIVDLVERGIFAALRRRSNRRRVTVPTEAGPIVADFLGRDVWIGEAVGASCGPISGAARVPSTPPGASPDVDATAIEIPRWLAGRFGRAGFVVLASPIHVQSLAGPPTAHETRILRRLEASSLRPTLSRSRRDLERFFRECYAPMIEKRHAAARPTPLSVLAMGLGEGWLLSVGDVSGAVLVPSATDSRTLQIWVVGVRGGDYDDVPDLARVAPVAFAVAWARAHGFCAVDHRLSPPLLANGLFRRKAVWGTSLVDAVERRDRIAVRFERDSPALVALVAAQPFVALSSSGLVGVHTGERPERWPEGLREEVVTPDAAALRALAERFAGPLRAAPYDTSSMPSSS